MQDPKEQLRLLLNDYQDLPAETYFAQKRALKTGLTLSFRYPNYWHYVKLVFWSKSASALWRLLDRICYFIMDDKGHLSLRLQAHKVILFADEEYEVEVYSGNYLVNSFYLYGYKFASHPQGWGKLEMNWMDKVLSYFRPVRIRIKQPAAMGKYRKALEEKFKMDNPQAWLLQVGEQSPLYDYNVWANHLLNPNYPIPPRSLYVGHNLLAFSDLSKHLSEERMNKFFKNEGEIGFKDFGIKEVLLIETIWTNFWRNVSNEDLMLLANQKVKPILKRLQKTKEQYVQGLWEENLGDNKDYWGITFEKQDLQADSGPPSDLSLFFKYYRLRLFGQ